MSIISELLMRVTPYVGAKPTRLIVAVVIAFLALDWAVLDRWGIRGRVADAESGQGIANAWVLADFSGDKPLLRVPAGPHPRSRTDACMGTRVTRSVPSGRFRFDTLTFNRPLAEKSAYMVVFSPGWLPYRRSSPIASSLITISPNVGVALRRGPGERQDTTRYRADDARARLPDYERTHSDELFYTARVVLDALASCGRDGIPMAVEAMKHVAAVAETFNERERARATCRFARKKVVEGGWPFDCDNLQFTHQASPEVLAVEAELAAKQKARKDSTEGA